jgi:hypothetical protein
MFEGFVFEDNRRTGLKHGASVLVECGLAAQYVQRLGLVKLHRLLELGRANLRIQLGSLERLERFSAEVMPKFKRR